MHWKLSGISKIGVIVDAISFCITLWFTQSGWSVPVSVLLLDLVNCISLSLSVVCVNSVVITRSFGVTPPHMSCVKVLSDTSPLHRHHFSPHKRHRVVLGSSSSPAASKPVPWLWNKFCGASGFQSNGSTPVQAHLALSSHPNERVQLAGAAGDCEELSWAPTTSHLRF